MRILLVEDDWLYIEALSGALRGRWPDTEIQSYASEHAFRAGITTISSFRPNVALIDVVLRWTVPSRTIPAPPPEVLDDGRFRAGIRCQQLLARNPATSSTPVILYTVLDRKDIQDDLRITGVPVVHIPKSSSMENLLRHVALMAKGTSGQ
jgi:CheY-like chemotaxis protein